MSGDTVVLLVSSLESYVNGGMWETNEEHGGKFCRLSTCTIGSACGLEIGAGPLVPAEILAMPQMTHGRRGI